mmetsp:Transcript_45483/g.98517  ORF Transcript_45483/g.98517 Transcript_45483/m.98517 type:complete len:111 (-) Transcript_45483:38-370(-)
MNKTIIDEFRKHSLAKFIEDPTIPRHTLLVLASVKDRPADITGEFFMDYRHSHNLDTISLQLQNCVPSTGSQKYNHGRPSLREQPIGTRVIGVVFRTEQADLGRVACVRC